MEHETVFLTITASVAADDVSLAVDTASEARMRTQNSSRVQGSMAIAIDEEGVAT
jgi:hypothetical protein